MIFQCPTRCESRSIRASYREPSTRCYGRKSATSPIGWGRTGRGRPATQRRAKVSLRDMVSTSDPDYSRRASVGGRSASGWFAGPVLGSVGNVVPDHAGAVDRLLVDADDPVAGLFQEGHDLRASRWGYSSTCTALCSALHCDANVGLSDRPAAVAERDMRRHFYQRPGCSRRSGAARRGGSRRGGKCSATRTLSRGPGMRRVWPLGGAAQRPGM